MNDSEDNKIAIRRAEAKLSFYKHLMIYLIVNAALAGANLLTYAQFLWFVYPLFGWGIAILIHGLVVFVERKLKKRLIENETRHLSEIR